MVSFDYVISYSIICQREWQVCNDRKETPLKQRRLSRQRFKQFLGFGFQFSTDAELKPSIQQIAQ
jgi:hypothetical protein